MIGKTRTVLILAWICFSGFDLLSGANDHIEEGNAQLGAGKFEEALKYYEQAAEALPGRPEIAYDKGIALYRLGRHQEALDSFLKGTESSDPQVKKQSFFNMGNTALALKQFDKAADAFRQALRLDPQDERARWNLEVALLQEQKQKEEQKKQQEKQNQKPEEEKDSNSKEKESDGGNQKPDPKQQNKKEEDKENTKPRSDEKQQQQKPEQQKQQQADQQPKP